MYKGLRPGANAWVYAHDNHTGLRPPKEVLNTVEPPNIYAGSMEYGPGGETTVHRDAISLSHEAIWGVSPVVAGGHEWCV